MIKNVTITVSLALLSQFLFFGAQPVLAEETTITIQQKKPLKSTEITQLMAGVASVDITPPAGIPLNGHSAWSNISRGVRTHLYAKAFYLRMPGQEPIAIVQVELLTGETMLHHRVAEIIAEKTDIPAHRLNLSATHTHAGPGQFHSSNTFNESASNQPGFDPAVFDFLSNQIANAVITAYNTQRPAKIATGSAQVWGFTRNRAMEPFVANPENKDKSLTSERKFHAIDPDLHMVRIDGLTEQGYKPLGAFATFAIHGTGVLTKDMNLYSGDVWSYISQEVQWKIQHKYNTPWQPVVGPFEGAHGDMAPNAVREKMGFMEARRIGVGIGEQAWLLFERLGAELTESATIAMGMREINVLENPAIGDLSLCDRAAFSLAQIAGPDEHSSPVIYDLPPFKRGWPDEMFNEGCQGEKRRAGSFFQELVFDKTDFPYLLDIQITRINEFLLVSVPFEMTVTAGRRIKQALMKIIEEKKINITHISIGSVANGYFGYAVTPEEYKLQWYEGGSTLYGPNTTPFLVQHSKKLFKEILSGGVNDLPKEWTFVLDSHSYLPQPVEFSVPRVSMGSVTFVDAVINSEAHRLFVFFGEPASNIRWHEPLIHVEYSLDGNVWKRLTQNNRSVDDRGYDISITLMDGLDEKGRQGYQVRWFNPEVNPARRYRFVIAARENQPVFSSGVFR